VVDVPNQINLYLLDLAGALGQLEEDEQPAVGDEVQVAADVEQQHHEADEVDGEVVRHVVVDDLLNHLQLLSRLELDRHEVQQYLEQIEDETDALQLGEDVVVVHEVLEHDGEGVDD